MFLYCLVRRQSLIGIFYTEFYSGALDFLKKEGKNPFVRVPPDSKVDDHFA